jgi:hypothetical protein
VNTEIRAAIYADRHERLLREIAEYEDTHPDDAPCFESRNVVVVDGRSHVLQLVEANPADDADAHAACEWCGRAIYSPLGSRDWLAVKGVERSYNPALCDASDDGKHAPAGAS